MRFSPLAVKLLIRSKKVRGGAEIARTSSITMPSMVGCMACVPAVDEKVWCLLSVFLSCFGMTKFVITETPWCSVIFKPVIVSLRRGRFVVVELYSTFSVDLQNFPSGKFVPKITIFHDFGGCKPTFLRHSLLHAKFCKKKSLKRIYRYPFWANLY